MNPFRSAALLSLFGAAVSASALTFSGVGGTVPDNGSRSFTIVGLPSLGSITSISINTLSHAYASDLRAIVTGPNGASVSLFESINSPLRGIGTEDSVFRGSYTFAVGGANLWAAANAVGAGATIAAGTYEPSSNLYQGNPATNYVATNYSAFNGVPAGTWTLTLYDENVGDSGSFVSWTINAEPAPVPEPASMIALGLGAVAIVRRRKRA